MHLLANKIPRLALYGNVLNGFLVLTETKKTSGYLVLSDMHLLADKNPRLTLYGNVLYGFLVLSETKKPRVILKLFLLNTIIGARQFHQSAHTFLKITFKYIK